MIASCARIPGRGEQSILGTGIGNPWPVLDLMRDFITLKLPGFLSFIFVSFIYWRNKLFSRISFCYIVQNKST